MQTGCHLFINRFLINNQFPSQSLEPPNHNLPPQDGISNNKHFGDAALPSIHQALTAKSSEKQADDHAVDHADGHGDGDGHHVVERYPITTINFSRVETPFIIGIWILFASIAKIGE